MKMPKLHADGIVRVFKRMHWEFTNILWPELKSHMTPLALLPFTHQYWNAFTERCRIQGAAYYNGHQWGFERILLVTALVLLYWRW